MSLRQIRSGSVSDAGSLVDVFHRLIFETESESTSKVPKEFYIPKPLRPWWSTGSLLGLACSFGASFSAAAVGAIASIDAKTFYRQLNQPKWAPPGGVFAPVWTGLFCCMSVSAWRVWRRKGAPGRSQALTIFAIQLGANALWSWLFFKWKMGAAATFECATLFGLIASNIIAFRKIDRLAGKFITLLKN